MQWMNNRAFWQDVAAIFIAVVLADLVSTYLKQQLYGREYAA